MVLVPVVPRVDGGDELVVVVDVGLVGIEVLARGRCPGELLLEVSVPVEKRLRIAASVAHVGDLVGRVLDGETRFVHGSLRLFAMPKASCAGAAGGESERGLELLL